MAGKLLFKRGAPWKWKKAAELVGDLKGLAEKGVTAMKKLISLGKCNSFVPGIKVLMSDGGAKPIEKIRVDDIDVDGDGFVDPPSASDLDSLDVQGMSMFDSSENAARVGLKGQVRGPTGPLPAGLGIVADGRGVGGPRALGHSTISPANRMPFEQYVGPIKGMNWQNVGTKLS